jgi:protocatechuate 3,4-dioxygenase beta subunit
VLRGGLGAAGALLLAACSGRSGGTASPATSSTGSPTPTTGATSTSATGAAVASTTTVAPAVSPTTLAPTPACDDGDDPTPSQTEGPYFTPGSPLEANLAAGVGRGTPLHLTGTVVRTDCTPVAGALVDVWHCDDAGEYDNTGYTLRGHQFTNAAATFAFDTIVPGAYPGRTRHIHVKVQAPGGEVLTTQLYFPGEPANARDSIYRPECELALTSAAGGGQVGTFTFVLV